MAERSRGGGLGWFIVGLLAGVALTLFSLVFINLRGERRDSDPRSGADEAAASAVQGEPTAATPIAPPPIAGGPPPVAETPKPQQPVTAADTAAAERAAAQAADDAQMQEDAASVGDTSRAPPR